MDRSRDAGAVIRLVALLFFEALLLTLVITFVVWFLLG